MKMKMVVTAAAMLMSTGAFAGVTGNIGAVNQYDFRGLNQSVSSGSGQSPAVQGGFDYAADSGLYLGTWASNVNWGAGHTEWDLYGGFTNKINDTLGYDVGVIGYLYPEQGEDHNDAIGNPNTVEFYAGLIVGPVTVKYFYSPAYFGLQEPTATGHKSTTNNSYLLISGSYPISQTFSATGSIGFTESGDKVWGDGPNGVGTSLKDNYVDYSVGVSKTLEAGFSASFSIVGTSFKNDEPGIVLGLKKTFDI